MANTISVKGAGNDNRVILWERHEAHPDGEIFLSNDGKARQVAETAAVQRKLADGALVKAGTQPAAAPSQPAPTPPPAAAQPWDGYDDATTDEIIERLRGMEPEAREQALAYERGNKNRVTITRVGWNS